MPACTSVSNLPSPSHVFTALTIYVLLGNVANAKGMAFEGKESHLLLINVTFDYR